MQYIMLQHFKSQTLTLLGSVSLCSSSIRGMCCGAELQSSSCSGMPATSTEDQPTGAVPRLSLLGGMPVETIIFAEMPAKWEIEHSRACRRSSPELRPCARV